MKSGYKNQKNSNEGTNYLQGGGFGYRPKSVTCTICGREFGTASIEIHQKTCIQKYQNQMVQLPGDIRRNMPNSISELNLFFQAQQVIQRVEQEREIRKNGGTKKGMQFEQQAQTNFALVPDNQCRQCGRKFNADRIQKHESVCIGPEPDVAAIKQKVIQQKQKAARYLRPKKTGKWREQHAEFQSAMKDMRKFKRAEQMGVDIRSLGPPARSAVNSSYVQCPHCMRNFNENSAAKHIPSCANVINRPKPPPGRSQVNQYSQSQVSHSQYGKPAVQQQRYEQSAQFGSKYSGPPKQAIQQQQPVRQHMKTPPQKQSTQKSSNQGYNQQKPLRPSSATKSQNLGGGGLNMGGGFNMGGGGRPMNSGSGGGGYQIAHSNVSTFSLFTGDGRPQNYERFQQSNPYAKKSGLY